MRPYPLESDALVEDVLAELDALTEGVERSFGALTDEQLVWQPSPEAWGVGQCLVHLARCNELYRQALTPLFRQGHARGALATRPLMGGWFGRWFTGAVGPSVRVNRSLKKGSTPRHPEGTRRFRVFRQGTTRSRSSATATRRDDGSVNEREALVAKPPCAHHHA